MSHFHIASMANNVEAVDFFLDHDVFIDHAINYDSPYFAGFTALHLAIRCCNSQVARLLLKRGANIHLKNAQGETASHMVIENYLKFAEDFLLGYFSDGDQWKIRANEEVAQLLLEMLRDDTMIIDESGPSCLHLACTMKDSSIAKELSIREDVNRSIKTESHLWPGYTALHFAAHVNVNTVKMLVERGADLTAEDANGLTPLDLCLKTYKVEFDIRDILASSSTYKEIKLTQGILLLDLITAMRDYKQFTSLLNRYYNSASLKVPSDAPLWAGFTPLHLLVLLSSIGNAYHVEAYSSAENMWSSRTQIYNSGIEKQKAFTLKKQHWMMIRELLDRNARIVTARDVHGRTPLHLAFHLSNMDYVIDLLLRVHDKFSFPSDFVDNEGLSILHIACTRNNKVFVEKLLASGNNVGLAYKGKSINNLMETGWTPLNVAAVDEQNEIVELLLKYSADGQISSNSSPSGLLIQREADIFVGDLEIVPNVFKYLDSFFTDLEDNEHLQKQVETKIGLTKVHVACYYEDSEWLVDLVKQGANVNAQLSADLPKCAGFTPLHFVFEDMRKIYNEWSGKTIELVKILLDAGADVTLSDAEERTPLHKAHSYSSPHGNVADDKVLAIVIMLLKGQKNFSINPTDKEGMSHFHIACKLSETAVVKKYLERGNLDVNQPTAFFNTNSKYCVAGFTPLHMAAIGHTIHVAISSQRQTVDLLLKHGADPHRQSSRGNTALHVTNRYEIFERISRTGADVNLVNAEGHTPLGFLLTRWYYPIVDVVVSADQILNWLRCGCCYNVFDIYTGVGYIRRTIDLIPFEEVKNLIEVAIINMPNAMRVDEMGRTAIHNVVTDDYHGGKRISTIQYALLIETFARSGCDLDSQDNLGRTPLHLAVKFGNSEAITALLMAGADVNICNNNGQTVLDYHTQRCGCDEDNSKWCNRFKSLAFHVRKLQICQLEVCPANRSYVTDKFVSAMHDEPFYSQLQEVTNTKIEPYQLTLGDFLVETNAVADYPAMSLSKKDAIDEFFCQEKMSDFRKKFNEVAGLLSLQYRKAVMRAALIEDAATSLNFLAGFPVPQICSRIIFGFLSNCDLKNLIASTKNCKGDGCKLDIPKGSLLKN